MIYLEDPSWTVFADPVWRKEVQVVERDDSVVGWMVSRRKTVAVLLGFGTEKETGWCMPKRGMSDVLVVPGKSEPLAGSVLTSENRLRYWESD